MDPANLLLLQPIELVAEKMYQAVPTKDRNYNFRTHKRWLSDYDMIWLNILYITFFTRSCFVGKEAVAWMISSKSALDEGDALDLGNAMMKNGTLI